MSEESVTFNLELNVEGALDSSRKVEMIIFRVIGLWNRLCRMLGVPADSPIMVLTQRVQQLTMLIRQLHTAAILANAAMVPGAGPIAGVMAGIGIAGAALSATDFMISMGD